MDKSQTSPWRTALQIGIIAGIAILYMGVVGMIASFHEREVIDGVVTLGQLAIILPAFLGGTIAASRLRAVGANPLMILIGALVTGALAALPTIILLFVNTQVEDIRDVLANVNNDWVEVVTFDNRNELLTGYLILTVVTTVSAMVGGLLALLPAKLRQALSFGLGLMLLIGMFSETMDLILRQIATDDIRDVRARHHWRRDLRLHAAQTRHSHNDSRALQIGTNVDAAYRLWHPDRLAVGAAVCHRARPQRSRRDRRYLRLDGHRLEYRHRSCRAA
jgi:hypothetical protein